MVFLLFARIGFLWTVLKETVMGELPTVRTREIHCFQYEWIDSMDHTEK